MTTRRAATTILALALAAAAAGSSPASASVLLRLDGVGPVKLSMSRTTALATGWLNHRGKGCPLGGPPVPTTYRFTGAAAPAGLDGTAQFEHDRLTVMSFTGGVHTTLGVHVGTSWREMARRYHAAGYGVKSQYVGTLGGRFVSVHLHGRQVLEGFAATRRISTLGIPAVPVCE